VVENASVENDGSRREIITVGSVPIVWRGIKVE
jgi:hypothetical protein